MVRLLGIPANSQQICWESQQTDYSLVRFETDFLLQQAPGRLIDSKIMVQLKILVVMLYYDHAAVVH